MVASRMLAQYEVGSRWVYCLFKGSKQSFSDECKMHKPKHEKTSTIDPDDNADMDYRTGKFTSGKSNAGGISKQTVTSLHSLQEWR